MIVIILFTAAVVLYTLTAAITDARERRVPNKLTIPAAAAGLVFHTLVFLWNYFSPFDLDAMRDASTANLTVMGEVLKQIIAIGPGWAILGFWVGFFLLFLPAYVGGGGFGDCKFLAALGMWMGIRWTILVFMLGVILAAIGMILLMVVQGPLKAMRQTRKRIEESKARSANEKNTPATKKPKAAAAFCIPLAIATWIILAFLLTGTLHWTLF